MATATTTKLSVLRAQSNIKAITKGKRKSAARNYLTHIILEFGSDLQMRNSTR
jgi:hypothetical protein